MPIARFQMPDGRIGRFEVPEGTTPEQAQQMIAQSLEPEAAPAAAAPEPKASATGSFGENALAGLGKAYVDVGRGMNQLAGMATNVVPGMGAGGPIDRLGVAMGLPSVEQMKTANQTAIDEAKKTDAELMKTGGGFIGNTAGQIGAYATGAGLLSKMAPATAAAVSASKYAPAIGGAIYGATQPVATDENRGTNMLIGGVGGALGQKVAQGIGAFAKGAKDIITPQAKALLKRAQELGIPVRAEQIVNSKPLNALVGATDYLPLTGTGKSAAAQQEGFNKAISKTVGEDTANLAEALTKASDRLGGEFDRVLQGNAVKADKAFVDDLADASARAAQELPTDGANVINRQIEEILSKVKAGDVIDGQAAYNIKRALDRIAKQNTPQAAHAADLKRSLMEALNRSLGKEEAAKFATTRGQYANLMELEKLAPRGADVDISPARLANARGIKTKDLGEIADIAAQFLKKGKIGDSGTAQRGFNMLALTGGAGAMGLNPLSAGLGSLAGRGVNAAMDSAMLRNYLTHGSPLLESTAKGAKRALPAIGAATGLQFAQ